MVVGSHMAGEPRAPAADPAGLANRRAVWHVSYYTWFSSAYQFCILCYPYIHRVLQHSATGGFLKLACANILVHGLHYLTLVLMEAVYLVNRDEHPEFVNYWIYGGYMFPPFWAVRFACGCLLGFAFLQYRSRPEQKAAAWGWAIVTDGVTLILVMTYVCLIGFKVDVAHRISSYSLLEDRMYCGVIPRLAVPFFAIWLYGLAVGRGYTAALLRTRVLCQILSPASYGMYLLHQPVFEWYSFAVKGRWWNQGKPGFEWFSPDPVELGWSEAILVIGLTVLFSVAVTHVVNTYLMGGWLTVVRRLTCRRRRDRKSSDAMVTAAIEDLAGARVELTANILDSGLASLGVAALVSVLKNMDASLCLTAADLVKCETVQDIVDVVDASKKLPATRSGLAHELDP